MKDYYDTTKKLVGKYTRTNKQVKDKEGNILTREDKQLQRWLDNFSELLNRPSPTEHHLYLRHDRNWKWNCERPSKEEIVQAVKKLKSGKAARPDNILPVALKADPYTTAGILYNLLGKIWEEEEMPNECNKSHIIKLPRKGDMRECKNYRGISWLTVVGKILSRVVLMHLRTAIDAMLRNQLAGFRKDRSCTDQIATLRIIVEQSVKWNTSVYVNFVLF